MDARRGHEQFNEISRKERLTGTLRLRFSADYKPLLSNLLDLPRRRKMKAPAPAGTGARAELSMRADKQVGYTALGEAAQ